MYIVKKKNRSQGEKNGQNTRVSGIFFSLTTSSNLNKPGQIDPTISSEGVMGPMYTSFRYRSPNTF